MRIVNLAGASLLLPIVPAPVIYYRGFELREFSGAVATIRVYDNTTNSGKILDEISFTANQSFRENYGVPKTAVNGVFVEFVAGLVVGSICFD